MRPRYTPAHPWQPLSDAEYALLCAFLPPVEHRRGRPPQDRRRTLDAIFWIACSTGPWKALPPELGKPDTAHRQLRRWARSGLLDRLLFAVSGRGPRGGKRRPRSPAERLLRAALPALEYRLCRAWRRMARLASVASLLLAKRLGLWTALPCAPWFLPNPVLSETLQRVVETLFVRIERSLYALPPGLLALCGKALAFAGGQPRRFRLA